MRVAYIKISYKNSPHWKLLVIIGTKAKKLKTEMNDRTGNRLISRLISRLKVLNNIRQSDKFII